VIFLTGATSTPVRANSSAVNRTTPPAARWVGG